jgi:hypothetical protein
MTRVPLSLRDVKGPQHEAERNLIQQGESRQLSGRPASPPDHP